MCRIERGHKQFVKRMATYSTQADIQQSVGWNYLRILKLEWLHRWSLRMDK